MKDPVKRKTVKDEMWIKDGESEEGREYKYKS